MELRQFVKHFRFRHEDRHIVTLGPGTRINPLTNRAQLGTYGVDAYPTDADLYVKSHLANPQAVREWQGFEAFVSHKKVNNETKTSAGFRLSDGTDEYYWNGASWEVNTADWNTEAEVASNIPSFPATARKLQVVINLKTDDASVTPELTEVRVLYGALLDDEIEDMVIRSIEPALRNALRPITRFVEAMAADGTTISLWDGDGKTKFDGAYKILNVDAAFNHTDDPSHDADIYLSHTSKPSGEVDVVTLSETVGAGKLVWLRLKYEPVVSVRTSRDYYELEKLPELVIEDVAFLGAEFPTDDHVGNRDTATARVIPGPMQGDLVCTLAGFADKLVDAQRLSAAVDRYFGATPLVTSTGLDESYRLWLEDKFTYRGSPNAQDLHSWRKVFRVQHFCVWNRPPRDGYLVKRFKTTGNVVITVQ